jgi:hypothetical protein
MSYSTANTTNIAQNHPDFKLPLPLDKKSIIFKKEYFIKVLDEPQEDPLIPRTVTVKCTYKNCL